MDYLFFIKNGMLQYGNFQSIALIYPDLSLKADFEFVSSVEILCANGSITLKNKGRGRQERPKKRIETINSALIPSPSSPDNNTGEIHFVID